MAQARLLVQRKSDKDLKMRDLLVRIDDQAEFNLNYSQSKEIDLAAGEHTIFATNRLYSATESFQIEEGEKAAYEVINVPSGCLAFLFMGLGMGIYKVKLERFDPVLAEKR
jgi:hypothetical protein